MKYVIYRGVFENGKMYIGLTCDFKRRLKEHKHSVNKLDRVDYPLYKAIRKYGWDTIKWDIVCECETLEEAKDMEIYYIEKFNLYNKGGYNASKGGDYPSENCYIHDQSVVDIIIEELKTSELTLSQIAEKNSVSMSYVSNILNGKIRTNEKIERESKQSQKGSTNGFSKLNEKQVSEIKQKLINGVSRKKLKDEYNVSKSTIQGIAVGTWWSHVEPKIPLKKKRNKVTKELLMEIKELLSSGKTSKSIQQKLGTSPNTVSKIKKGEYDHLLE